MEEPIDPEYTPTDPKETAPLRFAMRISLAFGVLMLVGKTAAYIMTGSAAILSDAAESVIHVVAVAFAASPDLTVSRPYDSYECSCQCSEKH